MWKCVMILFLLCLFSLLHQPSTAISYRLRQWKGFFLYSDSKCHNRCVRKHGFFKDDKGNYYMASVPKQMVVKCQCMVSGGLRSLITSRFGEKVANSYGRYNFFGFTKKGRDKLHSLAKSKKFPAIVFVSWDEFLQITKRREAVEAMMTTAAAETVVKMETYEELQRIAAQWQAAESMARAAGGAVSAEELQRIVAQRKAVDTQVREVAAALSRQHLAALQEAAEARDRAEKAAAEQALAQQTLAQKTSAQQAFAQQAAAQHALAQQVIAQHVPIRQGGARQLTQDDYDRILKEWRAILPSVEPGKSHIEILDQIIAKHTEALQAGGVH